MKIVLSQIAAADLERLRAFLAPKDLQASERAIETLVTNIDSLQIFPERYPAIDRFGTRQMFVPFGKDGYIVHYYLSSAHRSIAVLRIWHGLELRP